MNDQLEIIDKIIYENESRLFVIFKDDLKMINIFYGKLISNIEEEYSEFHKKIDREFYLYSSNEIYSFKNETNNVLKNYLGETLEFKKKDISDSFFVDLFKSAAKCFEEKIWLNLYDALENISEFFKENNDEKYLLKLKGYIGEMALVYYVMNNTKINNSLNLAREIFLNYQKEERKRHDYKWNSELKLEVKSTSGEGMNFLIKNNQQKIIDNQKLYYAFVKYDFTQEKYGISFKAMLDEIYKKLDIQVSIVPNHLMLFSERYPIKNIFIDVKSSIEVYLINSNKLPNFNEYNKIKSIIEINYKLNIIDFLLTGYDEQNVFNEIYNDINATKILEGENNNEQ